MSNTFVNHTWVARETLRQLKNNLVMANLMHRGYQEEWNKDPNGWKVGDTITLQAPIYFRVKDGATIDVVDLLEQSTTFQLAYRKHVAWKVTTKEMTLDRDVFSRRFIEPAAQALANYIDLTCLGLYQNIPNQVGTPGTTPSQWYTIAEAGAVLDDHAVPPDNRHCVLDPWAQAKLADQLKGLLHTGMVGKAVEKGKFGDLSGFSMYMSQNVNSHTCGSGAGTTIAVDAASSEEDTSIKMDNASSGWTVTLKQGDIFTVATVNGVNPISGQSTGRLRQFVVDADVGSSSSDATVTCTPGTAPYKIRSASANEDKLPYQTVDALPANNDSVTVAGSASLVHKVNLAFHRDALSLAMVPLDMPESASWKAQETYDGYTVRVIKDYDIINDVEYIRFDVLFGVKAINPFMACRIAG